MKVPEGWIISSFSSLDAKIIDGDRGKKYPSKEDYKTSGKCLFLGANNIFNDGLNIDKSLFLSSEKHKQLGKGIIAFNDILLIMRGNGTGRVCSYDPTVSPYPIARINSGLVIIRLEQKKISLGYTLQLMRSNCITEQFNRFMFGSAQPQLTVKILKSLKIPHPPLPEQRKIAMILGTWYKAIATTEKLITTSKQQKKSLMQQLLKGKKRLNNPETGVSFEGDWEELMISQLCSRLMEKNKGQSTNVVTISAQHGLILQEEFFKKIVASETLDNYFILRKGQFAYNKSYSNGYPMGAIKRLNRYKDAVVTTLYICFEIKDEEITSSCFLEQYFESGLLNRGLTKVAAEGGRAHGLLNVKPTDFMGLKMKLPLFKEQQKIASVLTTADKEIETLNAKLSHLKQEKKALMQQLLTGKRRVKAEEELEVAN